MILTLLPIVLVDVYGLIKYRWGDQFYVMLIDSMLLAVATIVLTIIEFKAAKVMKGWQ